MKYLFVVLSFLTFFNNGVKAQGSEQWQNAVSNVEAMLSDYIQRSDELLRSEDDLYSSINVDPLTYAGNACANLSDVSPCWTDLSI